MGEKLAMKIVAVLGSPRPQGSSASLARKFLDEARSLGAETKIYPLTQLDFKGFQGCRTCKTKGDQCVLKDDLAEVLAAVKGADLLLLASPTASRSITKSAIIAPCSTLPRGIARRSSSTSGGWA